jgi:tetratricopeptide (TPR) repeat protein
MKRPIVPGNEFRPQLWGRFYKNWVLSVVVGVISLAVFWPTLRYGFLNWDDDRNFLQNEHFRGWGAHQWSWAWKTFHLGVWQPLAWVFFEAEYARAEMDPWTYHFSSILLHALNASAFCMISSRLLRMGRPATAKVTDIYFVSALATVLFAIHPLRVEPVAWISAQPYLPATLMYLGAVGAYLRVIESSNESRRAAWLIACFAIYCCGIMFKASAISLPVILLILDFYFRQTRQDTASTHRKTSRLMFEKIPFFGVAVVACIWAGQAKDFNESRIPFSIGGINARIAQASYSLLAYLFKTILPIHLTPYDRLPSRLSLLQPLYALCFGTIICLTLVLYFRRRRWPGAWAAWLSYCAILMPNAGLVQISQQITADRYAYLAIMPIMILLAGGLLILWNRAKSAIIVAGVVLSIILIIVTRTQMAIWRDSRALWSAALTSDPECAVVACNLGAACLEESRYEESVTLLRRAIALDDAFSFAHSNLGVAYLAQGNLKSAVDELEFAIRADPPLGQSDLAKTHASLGAAYAGLRKDDLAWRHTLKARELGFAQSEKMIEYLSKFSRPPASTLPD